MAKKIVILNGSPRTNGNTSALTALLGTLQQLGRVPVFPGTCV